MPVVLEPSKVQTEESPSLISPPGNAGRRTAEGVWVFRLYLKSFCFSLCFILFGPRRVFIMYVCLSAVLEATCLY